jgi:hypothetical protein
MIPGNSYLLRSCCGKGMLSSLCNEAHALAVDDCADCRQFKRNKKDRTDFGRGFGGVKSGRLSLKPVSPHLLTRLCLCCPRASSSRLVVHARSPRQPSSSASPEPFSRPPRTRRSTCTRPFVYIFLSYLEEPTTTTHRLCRTIRYSRYGNRSRYYISAVTCRRGRPPLMLNYPSLLLQATYSGVPVYEMYVVVVHNS